MLRRESFWIVQVYTPLCKKDIKQNQNSPMETKAIEN